MEVSQDKHLTFIENFAKIMSGGESYPQLSVAFSNSKYRSPPRNRSTQLDELTDDIFMPLVDGDEFQEQEGEGINTFSQYAVFFPFLGRSLKYMQAVMSFLCTSISFWF